jgi:hypothetical protein
VSGVLEQRGSLGDYAAQNSGPIAGLCKFRQNWLSSTEAAARPFSSRILVRNSELLVVQANTTGQTRLSEHSTLSAEEQREWNSRAAKIISRVGRVGGQAVTLRGVVDLRPIREHIAAVAAHLHRHHNYQITSPSVVTQTYPQSPLIARNAQSFIH